MADLYKPELYREELPFEDAKVGLKFPAFSYAVTKGHMDAYVEGVTGGLDGERVEAALADPLLPSLVALNFGFVYSAMGCRPPTGFLNSSVQIEIDDTVEVGAPLSMTVSVVDRQIKRERKYVTLHAVVTKADGAAVCSARIGCIFP